MRLIAPPAFQAPSVGRGPFFFIIPVKLTSKHHSEEFKEILGIIQSGRTRAFAAVNVAPIETYLTIGEQLSRKVSEAGWGKGVVTDLASWLASEAPDLKGFPPQTSGA